MISLQIIRPQDGLPPEIGKAILELTTTVWPLKDGEEPLALEEVLSRWRKRAATHIIIGQDGKSVRAHAQIFRREIFTMQGPLVVGALAAVCVHPDDRGRGWGADVVRAAFDFLPELGVEVSLFQTPVPHFYEKLGCRIIHNRFFNGDNPNNPFWDKCEMIYPAAFAWPDGDIDLNGPGY